MVRILIVDDNKYVRMLLRSMLEKNDYEVVGEAGDKVEAINQFKKLDPEVILMDLRMPEEGSMAEVAMSGISATEEIKKLNPGVKIIVLTAAAQEKYKENVMKVGADRYITKPYKEKDIIEGIQETLAS
ncbi:MAG: response regulator [Candidatus Hadarchaeota archaeon]